VGAAAGAAVASKKAGANAQTPSVEAEAQTPTPAPDSLEENLTELASLKDKGIITEEEFQAKRKQILGL
jgi:hypothetical protein